MEVERLLPCNASQSMLANSTGYVQTRMMNEIIQISDLMTAQMADIRIAIAGMKSTLSQRSLLTAVTEDKKHRSKNDMENLLTKNFPGYKTAFNK